MTEQLFSVPILCIDDEEWARRVGETGDESQGLYDDWYDEEEYYPPVTPRELPPLNEEQQKMVDDFIARTHVKNYH